MSSDFKRTRETAEILHTHLQVETPLRYELALRERNFGQFELSSHKNYQKIWDLDPEDPTHSTYGNESVMDVVTRTSKLLQSLDEEFSNRIILLVSHGDVIQILSTLFYGVPPSKHHTLPYIGNCEIREVKRNTSSGSP